MSIYFWYLKHNKESGKNKSLLSYLQFTLFKAKEWPLFSVVCEMTAYNFSESYTSKCILTINQKISSRPLQLLQMCIPL